MSCNAAVLVLWLLLLLLLHRCFVVVVECVVRHASLQTCLKRSELRPFCELLCELSCEAGQQRITQDSSFGVLA